MQDTGAATIEARLIAAILPHVAFEGWSEAAFAAACRETGTDPALARLSLPRGAVDLACAHHRAGDRALVARLAADPPAGRMRERIAQAICLRLELAGDREVARRSAALMALPHLAPEGAALIWGTADAIWTALGDRAEGFERLSKRTTLAGVYTASFLYWLGDNSPDATDTAGFVARRIEEVMGIETLKARLREGPLGRAGEWVAARTGRGEARP
ncbi:MAG: COQ9 family protein [Gemmobacter sp.]|jgi:ubiquinone biosynthesis protein COQ9